MRTIEARIARLLDWPEENGEGLQVLHYRPGTEYKPHYDYFDPAEPGTPTILKRGGQRVATVVMYLAEPGEGRWHHVSRRPPGDRAQARQRRLLQLRAPASLHAHPARRRAGAGRREVDRYQVAARAPLYLKGRVKVRANGIAIEVEDTGADGSQADRPVVLLVMGLGMQLVAWPAEFVQALVQDGFRVVRFDNRDIGLSQHLDELGIPNLVWESVQAARGLGREGALHLA